MHAAVSFSRQLESGLGRVNERSLTLDPGQSVMTEVGRVLTDVNGSGGTRLGWHSATGGAALSGEGINDIIICNILEPPPVATDP